MPKEYTDCVKRNIAKGMEKDNAQRKCAIWYYKTFGKRPQDVEGASASFFDMLEAIDDALAPREHADEEAGLDEAAKWSYQYKKNLPNSAFLYVDPKGGRHLPYKDKGGKVDLPHLRNAISRLEQSKTGKGWLTSALRARLLRKARNVLKKHGGNPKEDDKKSEN
jgi:hypothetical protein